MVTIFVVLIGVTAVSVATAWRNDALVRQLNTRQHQDHEKVLEIEKRVDSLKTNFMKVLIPIRQNSEDIDVLDDDLLRIQKLIEELKKRKEDLAPPPAQV